MDDRKHKWRESMKRKYGVDDAGLSQIMRERQVKAMATRKNHKGGFNYMSKEELSALGREAAKKRWQK